MKHGISYKHPQIQALADALSALPGDAERERLVKSFDVVIGFFNDLRRRVQSLPSSSERAKALTALQDVSEFLDRAKDNQVLAAGLGLAYERAERRPGRAAPPASRSAQALFEELKTLSTEGIQGRLNDYKRVTMNDLYGLASLLGLKFEERMKRQDLVDRIVKLGFANIRGYDLLRGGEASKAPEKS